MATVVIQIDPPYDNNISVIVARSNVSTVNRGPLPDAPDGDYEKPAPKTDSAGVYLEPRQLTDTHSDAEDDHEGNTTDVTEDAYLKSGEQMDTDPTYNHTSMIPPAEVAPSTPGGADVTDDAISATEPASQDNENNGG